MHSNKKNSVRVSGEFIAYDVVIPATSGNQGSLAVDEARSNVVSTGGFTVNLTMLDAFSDCARVFDLASLYSEHHCNQLEFEAKQVTASGTGVWITLAYNPDPILVGQTTTLNAFDLVEQPAHAVLPTEIPQMLITKPSRTVKCDVPKKWRPCTTTESTQARLFETSLGTLMAVSSETNGGEAPIVIFKLICKYDFTFRGPLVGPTLTTALMRLRAPKASVLKNSSPSQIWFKVEKDKDEKKESKG